MRDLMGYLTRGKMLFLCLVFCCCVPAAAAAARNGLLLAEPEIRVGLWTKQASVSLSADAPMVLLDAAGRKALRRFPANEKLFITEKDGKLRINGKDFPAAHFFVALETADAAKSLTLNRKSYRGELEILRSSSEGVTAVNRLPLEEYLYSIVPGEMPASWNMEAIKAQAVAARSFALNSMAKHAAEGFDVCASSHCQVYGGRGVELERSSRAVDETRGLAMLYDNKPIAAVFHSSSGGYTENSEAVWGAYCPYLRSVKDYDENSPYYRWEKKFTPQEMQKKLESYGYAIGKLQALELSTLHKGDKNAADRTEGGRIKTMRFIGDQSNVAVDGGKVRLMLGLNSTLFDIKMIVPSAKGIEVPVGMYYKKTIGVDLPPYQEKGLPTDGENIRRVHWRDGEQIVVEGFGWGHGLGMSQWGAKAMADRAAEAGDTYFKWILAHYYPGAALKKIY